VCGNGQIDDCWAGGPPHGCNYYWWHEICDGAVNVPACTALGFYGGTATCPQCRGVDTADCEACPPGSTTCITEPAFALEAGAVSGTQVALAADGGLRIYDGLTFAHATTFASMESITAVPGGWLVRGDDALHFVDANGVASVLPPTSLSGKLVYGAGNRVLGTWVISVSAPNGEVTQRVRYSIAESNGVVVYSALDLFDIGNHDKVTVASSTTSFFLGADGKLARIAPDATFTVETGFPTGSQVSVLWSGTTGWYVAFTVSGTSAQRFDGNGSKVGLPIALAEDAQQVTPDGDDILVLRTSAGRLVVDRVDTTGAVMATSSELGAGVGAGAFFTRIGNQTFVAWSRSGHLQLSLIDF
jgi:hypothetical protein